MDVEMLEMQKENLNNELAKRIVSLDDVDKELLQEILSSTGASSHMYCVLKKL